MIICYSKSEKVLRLLKQIPEEGIREVATQEELASTIVGGSDISLVLIHLEEISGPWEGFLSSLRKTFTLLESCLLLPPGRAKKLPGYDVIEFNEETLIDDVKSHLASLARKNRRRHQRFDWPLTGHLIIPRQSDAEGNPVVPDKIDEKFRVGSISSTGAFLESDSFSPRPDIEGTIMISFHDFKVLTGCRVVGGRRASEGRSPGFGIEYTDLTTTSQAIIDEMVQDELLRRLINPDKPPRPPSLT